MAANNLATSAAKSRSAANGKVRQPLGCEKKKRRTPADQVFSSGSPEKRRRTKRIRRQPDATGPVAAFDIDEGLLEPVQDVVSTPNWSIGLAAAAASRAFVSARRAPSTSKEASVSSGSPQLASSLRHAKSLFAAYSTVITQDRYRLMVAGISTRFLTTHLRHPRGGFGKYFAEWCGEDTEGRSNWRSIVGRVSARILHHSQKPSSHFHSLWAAANAVLTCNTTVEATTGSGAPPRKRDSADNGSDQAEEEEDENAGPSVARGGRLRLEMAQRAALVAEEDDGSEAFQAAVALVAVATSAAQHAAATASTASASAFPGGAGIVGQRETAVDRDTYIAFCRDLDHLLKEFLKSHGVKGAQAENLKTVDDTTREHLPLGPDWRHL